MDEFDSVRLYQLANMRRFPLCSVIVVVLPQSSCFFFQAFMIVVVVVVEL